MQFNSLNPELYVNSFTKSLDFYIKILGFNLEYQRTSPSFAFLSLGDAQLMIQELRPGEKEEMRLEYPFGRGINFEIHVPNLNSLIESINKHSYPLTRGVKESWRDIGLKDIRRGSKEILINDPDGYLLRFAEDLGERSLNQTNPTG